MGSTNGTNREGGFNGMLVMLIILEIERKMNDHKNNKKKRGLLYACQIVNPAPNHNNEKMKMDKLALGNWFNNQSLINVPFLFSIKLKNMGKQVSTTIIAMIPMMNCNLNCFICHISLQLLVDD
jgi:hypothetical protein